MSILAIQRRQREIGRLRLGTKDKDRGYPKALTTWRLTSPNHDLLTTAADMYGGTVTKWDDQWEVVTQTASLPVMIPAQDIRQDMELWSRGGLIRRCDGQTAMIATKQEGVFIEQPCVCAGLDDDDEQTCKPSTLLKFWLPDIPGLGVWVLSSTGWNVASELAADVELLAGKNVRAKLSIEQRERKVAGQTKKFVVPVLDIPVSLADLLAGGFALPAPSLPSPPDTGKENTRLLPPTVGEEPYEAGGDGNTIEHVVGDEPLDAIAARAIERMWVDLRVLVESGPPSGTMEEMEVALRSLFRLSEKVGVVKSGERALHAALEKRGAAHVGDLKKAELSALCKDAWEWATGQVT